MKLISTIIKILILLVFLLLAITNTHTVSFFYLPGQNVNLPLIVVLFGAFIIGIVFGMFALFGRLLILRSENNRLRAEVKKYAHLSEKDLTPVKTENTDNDFRSHSQSVTPPINKGIPWTTNCGLSYCPSSSSPFSSLWGWFAARVDMKTVLKQAKSIPAGFYKSLDALVDRNSGRAARELAEVIDQQPQSYDLNLTLGKLYRQRGENDKAINMHRALLDSPDTVNEKRARVLFELAQNYQSAGLVDRAEQIFLGLQEGDMAREARQHLLSIYQQDRDWEKPSKWRSS